MNAAITLTKNLGTILLSPAAAGAWLLVFSGTNALADWPDNNPNVAKWYQFPDRSSRGYDILAGTPPASPTGVGQAIILADDFQCTRSGPITDIHIWASWLGLTAAANVPPIPITLGIWDDVPAVTNSAGVTPSHPGNNLLWSQTFVPANTSCGRTSGAQRRNVSGPGSRARGILGSEFIIWQSNFYPATPFVQQVGTVYWLSMTAATAAPAGTVAPLFGWKTTATTTGVTMRSLGTSTATGTRRATGKSWWTRNPWAQRRHGAWISRSC